MAPTRRASRLRLLTLATVASAWMGCREAPALAAPGVPAGPVAGPSTRTPGQGPFPPARWVTGYYTHWQRHLYPVERIDWSALTHVVVANVTPTPDGGIGNVDFGGSGRGWAEAVVDTAHAHGRKALLMVGGAATGPAFRGAASDANRARFARALVTLALSPRADGGLGFDGLDLDWEPIEHPGDERLVRALAEELRALRPGMLLTFPVSPGQAHPWYGTVAGLFDHVNLMTYAMSGAWDGWKSWHHAALYGEGLDHPSSVAGSVDAFLRAGVPAAKLGIGLGLYGTIYAGGSRTRVTGPLLPIEWGAWCDRDNDNVNTYANIMANYWVEGAYHWDDRAMAGSLSFPDGHGPARATWVTYEDERSIAEKGRYVRANGLGGAIVWTIASGCTDARTGENRPLRAIRRAFLE